jgi:hypothetical protein
MNNYWWEALFEFLLEVGLLISAIVLAYIGIVFYVVLTGGA